MLLCNATCTIEFNASLSLVNTLKISMQIEGLLMDGASNNRKFLKMQCDDDKNYTIISPFNRNHSVTVMLDPMVSILLMSNN